MADETYELPVIKKYIQAIVKPFFVALEKRANNRVVILEAKVEELEARIASLEP